MDDTKNIDIYVKQIEMNKSISREEENELSSIIHNPTSSPEDIEKAKDKLVRSNLMLVMKIALKFYHNIKSKQNCNSSKLDLISEANIALVDSARLYNVNNSNTKKFSSYLYPAVNMRLKRLTRRSMIIRIPDPYFGYQKAIKSLVEQYGDDLTDTIIIKELDISKNVLKKVKDAKHLKFSIDEEYDDGSACIQLEDAKPNPYGHLEHTDVKEFLENQIAKLTPMQQKIIQMYYFENTSGHKVAEKIGITPQAVYSAIKEALKILRFKCGELDE